MASTINLGNFVTNGSGKTVSSGIGSGLDTEGLIKSLVALREQPAVDLGKTKTANTAKITALADLRTRLNAFQTSLAALRNAGSTSTDVFQQRQGFITSSDGVAATNYLGISAGNNADITAYDIKIDHLAKNKIQRTNAFTSATSGVTDVLGSSNPGRFAAGTFQIAGGNVSQNLTTPANYTLTSAQITKSGTIGGSVFDNTFGAGGIDAITVSGGTGDKGLVGSLSTAKVSATQTAGVGGNINLSVVINGKTYTSGNIAANSGGSSNEIAAATVITLSNSDTGTSFQIRTGAAITVASNSDLSTFSGNVYSALSSITFSQSRAVSSFDSSKTAGTTLAGLVSGNLALKSDNYNAYSGAHGAISNFVVAAVSTAGAADATVQVTIDGEAYTATGLGGGVGDTQSGIVTLTSASGRTLTIDLGAAGVTLDLSNNTNAKTVQKDLNTVFGTGVNITLSQGDSLNVIAGKINSTSPNSGVSATVVKVGDNDFRLSMQSIKTGLVNAYSINDVVNNSLSSVVFNNVQTAIDAQFSINNATITRPLNNVSDVINNVTFNLFGATPVGTTLNVSVESNGQAVSDAVTNFVTAYNDLKTFAAVQQEQNADGTYKDTALLGDSAVLDSALTNIQTQLSNIVAGLGANSLKSLADIGITFSDLDADTLKKIPQVNNTLAIDQTKFITALTTSYDDIKKIFDFSFNSSANDKLKVFSRTNEFTVNNFDVDIDTTRASGQQVKFLYKDSNGVTQSVFADFTSNSGGGLIKGRSGTPFAGLELLYVGSGQDVITNNTATQGIADRLFNIIDPALADKGSLDLEVSDINTQNDQITKDVETIEDQVATYRDQLTVKYSALNAAIQKANNILLFLDAQSAANNNN